MTKNPITMKQKPASKQPSASKGDHTHAAIMSDQQLYGNTFHGKRYVKIEYHSLNNYQNFLYNRALFGLNVYSQEEIKSMRWDKKQRILKVHKRSQTVLNLWKQQIINALSTHLFLQIFPTSYITEDLVNSANDTDSKYISRISFRTLRITRAQIINKLIMEGILPPDFYKLEDQTACM